MEWWWLFCWLEKWRMDILYDNDDGVSLNGEEARWSSLHIKIKMVMLRSFFAAWGRAFLLLPLFRKILSNCLSKLEIRVPLIVSRRLIARWKALIKTINDIHVKFMKHFSKMARRHSPKLWFWREHLSDHLAVLWFWREHLGDRFRETIVFY